MSNRMQQRKQRHKGSSADDQRRAAQHRPNPRNRILAALALAVLAAAAITAVALRTSNNTTSDRPAQAADSDPFGPHYAGLDARRRAVGIPTMMDTMSSTVHFHPLLQVFVDGKPIAIPANIGIDPRADPMQMAGLHTHDTTGTIHVEGVSGSTLAQFFAIWGVPLSAQRLGPDRALDGTAVRMWVDGKPSRAFGGLKLADGQHIVIAYGPRHAPA